MSSSILDMLNSFKSRGKSSFKNDYTIKNPTHLIDVAKAIAIFYDTKNLIIKKEKSSIDRQVKEEFTHIDKIINDEQLKTLCKCLMQYEKDDKYMLKNILELNIMNKAENPSFLMKFIHSQSDAKEVALSIGILDDYIEYLKNNKYEGPVTDIE